MLLLFIYCIIFITETSLHVANRYALKRVFIQIYLMHCFGKYSSQCFLNLNVLLFFLSLDSCKYILQYSNGKGSSSGEIYSLFVIFGKKFGQIMQYLSTETLFILHEKVATLNNSICIDLCFNVWFDIIDNI